MLRNLLYNCCALACNDEWRLNVERLNHYADIFNGRKIVIIRTGPDTVDLETIKKAFSFDVEFRLEPNDPALGEVPGFIEALEELKSERSDEITFYAHTKGVGRAIYSPAKTENVRLWRNAMYRACLSDRERVDRVMGEYASCGCFRQLKRFPDNLIPNNNSAWHFSGTFFWFRHDKIFSKNWRTVAPYRHGVEAYLGTLLPAEEAFCLLEDRSTRNLYENWIPSTYQSEHVLIVSDEAQLVFLHNHKTAGQSVMQVLKQLLPDLRYTQPFIYPTENVCLREELRFAGLSNYHVFGFVRNPWDRLVSWYAMLEKDKSIRVSLQAEDCKLCARKWRRDPLRSCMRCRKKRLQKRWPQLCGYRKRFMEHAVDFPSFLEHVVFHQERGLSLARSQLDAYFSDAQGELVTTLPVGRFENLQEDFSAILKAVGLPAVQLPKKNASRHDHYSSYYNETWKRRVAAAFERDIQMFGYTFE